MQMFKWVILWPEHKLSSAFEPHDISVVPVWWWSKSALCYLIVHLFKAESGSSSINHRSCFLQHQVSHVTLNHNRSNICIKCSRHGCKHIWMPLVLAQGLRNCLTSVTRCQRFFSAHRTSRLLLPSSVYSVFLSCIVRCEITALHTTARLILI